MLDIEKQIATSTKKEIVTLMTLKEYKTCKLLERYPPVFVLCGSSGSRKTSSVDLANKQLPQKDQIAESLDMLFTDNVDTAIFFIENDDSAYIGATHIAYSTTRLCIGQGLHKHGTFLEGSSKTTDPMSRECYCPKCAQARGGGDDL